MLLISVAWFPPTRSVRPIEPANNTSPVITQPDIGKYKAMLPGECPGTVNMVTSSPQISIFSLSLSSMSMLTGSGSKGIPNMRACVDAFSPKKASAFPAEACDPDACVCL